MSSYRDNKIAEVRPGSTFERFEIYDPAQGKVIELLRGVADQVLERGPLILAEQFPFNNGKILFLWSSPGHGKTHLVEAFVNHIQQRNKRLLDKMVLSRGRFYFDFQLDSDPYHVPIVVVDDMFHDKMSLQELHPATELRALMSFITMVYEKRVLALVTSNFPMLEGGGLMARVQQVDTIGRTVSRAKEVLAGSGEIHLSGKDFRDVLAKRSRTEGFTL